MQKMPFLLTVILLFAASCNLENPAIADETNSLANQTVPLNAVTSLICGSETDCLSQTCVSAARCPLQYALSNKDVFDFVKTHSECEGCDTPTFSPDKGIGKCVEYSIVDEALVWTVALWVSENCKFRHSDPTQSRIVVKVNQKTLAIDHLDPAAAYIRDPLFCRVGPDCRGLSGSGVPLIGCSNFLHAPLNWAGYYPYSDDMCACVENQCKQK